MMTDDEIIAVVQANKEGKQLEWKPNWAGDEWAILMNAKPVWNFDKYSYRVKPEPRKPREWTINITKEPVLGDIILGGCEYGRTCGIPGNAEQVRVREVIDHFDETI